MPMNCELNALNALSSKFSNLKVIAGGVGSIVLSGVDKSLSDDSSFMYKDGTKVAIKRLPLVGKGQCRAALRELMLLKRFEHENIVNTFKITDCNGCTIDDPSLENFKEMESVYVVEELLDTDLHKIISTNSKISLDMSKLFLYQLLRGLKYIHSANVIHRDIKPGNIFINRDDLSLKIGDYGLARVFDERYKHKGYLTAVVSTRYYRAPEVMIDLGNYSYSIDIWSAGCVFAEMILGKVLFSGENDLDQLNVICSTYGVTIDNIYNNADVTFPQHLFEGFPPEVVDLLSKLLCLNPNNRVTAEEALKHPFFSDLHDPEDEPVCKRPFYIEHEIDNLPVKILKKKILRNSCMTSFEKKSYHSSEENLFKEFDETFILRDNSPVSIRKIHHLNTSNLNSQGEETETSLASSLESPHSSTCFAMKKVAAPIIINSSANPCNNNNEDFVLSLKDAMTHEAFIDEPFRDPGVCERKYHELEVPVKSNVFTETNETSYFSSLSPVIDMNEPTYPSRIDTEIDKNKANTTEHFLEINGRSCADNSKCNSQNEIYTSKTSDHCSSLKKGHLEDIRSINSEILRTLSDRKDCKFEALLSDKFSKQPSARPLAHWSDSLKFWI